MATDFDQVVTKLRWSHHQLTYLHEVCAAYADSKPYVAVIEYQPEAKIYRAVAKLETPPWPELSLALGDVLNNLHGVMDYLAWQLVLLAGEVPGDKTAFPIFKTRRVNKDGTEQRVNILDRVREPAIKDLAILGALDAVQPYIDGDLAGDSPFEIIRRLNGASKHRHPVLLAVAVSQGAYMFEPKMPTGVEHFGIRATSISISSPWLKDGDEIARVHDFHVSDAGLPDEAQLPTHVALEQMPKRWDGSFWALEDLCDGLYVCVREGIVRQFAAFFGAEAAVEDLPPAPAEVAVPVGDEDTTLFQALFTASKRMYGGGR